MNKQGNKKGQTEVLLILGVIVFVVAFIIAMLGFDTVEANHLGVMVEFGKIKGVMHPGTTWTGLFTNVVPYDMRTRKATVILEGNNNAVDKTGQTVYATINVNYRLKTDEGIVQKLYANIGSDDQIANVLNIEPIIVEGFKQATVKYDSLEILEKRQEVKELAIENIKSNFPKEYFEVQDVVVTNIDFSVAFKDAIEQKKVAEQNAIKEKNQLQVVIYQQQQAIETYKAQAEQIKLQAAQLTDLTVKQAWIQKWDGRLPTYMLTSQGTENMLLQLPTTPAISGGQ